MGRYRIGFDFGTSTTKVCYYELDRNEFGLYKWNGNIDRPTVVSVKRGKLQYARNADLTLQRCTATLKWPPLLIRNT